MLPPPKCLPFWFAKCINISRTADQCTQIRTYVFQGWEIREHEHIPIHIVSSI